MTTGTAEKAESVPLTVLLPEPMRDAVVEMAKAEQRSIGGQTRKLLAEALSARESEADH